MRAKVRLFRFVKHTVPPLTQPFVVGHSVWAGSGAMAENVRDPQPLSSVSYQSIFCFEIDASKSVRSSSGQTAEGTDVSPPIAEGERLVRVPIDELQAPPAERGT